MPNTNNSLLIHRAEGALLGHALGNALGLGYESCSRETLPFIDRLAMPGRFLPPGSWSDDTGLMLSLAYSLLEKGFEPEDQMLRYLAWQDKKANKRCWPLETPPPPLGSSTQAALEKFRHTDEVFSGNTSNYSAGNGGLMRLLPLVIWNLNLADEGKFLQQVADATRTTHGSLICIEASQLLALLLRHILLRDETAEIETCLLAFADAYWEDEDIGALAAGDYLTKPEAAIRSGGYVLETLEAALWAFSTSSTAKEALITAVNLGGDCDTVAAITGSLAGAWYGVEQLPEDWLDDLIEASSIKALGEKLLKGAAA